MDKQQIVREQLVARYVAGQLDGQEREEFEAYCIAHPEIGSELELERRLREGMKAAARRGWIEVGLPKNAWHRWAPTAVAASIASVAAIGGAAWLARESPFRAQALVDTRAHLDAHRGAAAEAFIVSLSAIRGASAEPDAVLRVGELPDHVVLEPEVVALTCADGSLAFECSDGSAPSRPQYPRYQLEVMARNADRILWQSVAQTPGIDGHLAFVIHSRDLEAGDFDLIVRGLARDHSEVVGRFWLQVKPREGA
jgi:hypothetical protein